MLASLLCLYRMRTYLCVCDSFHKLRSQGSIEREKKFEFGGQLTASDNLQNGLLLGRIWLYFYLGFGNKFIWHSIKRYVDVIQLRLTHYPHSLKWIR